MSGETGIEYLTARWNPVVGCTHVSEGCRNCWAEKQAKRWGQKWGAVRLHPDRLDIPLHWRKPRRVGVCFMGDLFHEQVPNKFIGQVFETMRDCRRHTFLVLTKRPQRARNLIGGLVDLDRLMGSMSHTPVWPLPNVWLGVSVEDQRTADERLPFLVQTPAALRWVSVEPMLGPVDLNKRECLIDKQRFKHTIGNYLDWVVLGGESGPGARPMHSDWARSVRDQCVAAGVPFNFKQWGEWIPAGHRWESIMPYNRLPEERHVRVSSDVPPLAVYRVGKERAGRTLDGRTWDEFPTGCKA